MKDIARTLALLSSGEYINSVCEIDKEELLEIYPIYLLPIKDLKADIKIEKEPSYQVINKGQKSKKQRRCL